MLTLSTNQIGNKLEKEIEQYILDNKLQVIFKHITFEWLLSTIRKVLDDRDHEMISVLDDYSRFCYESGLIPDKWKWMVARAVSKTKETNMRLNLYFDVNKMKGYDYIGLYDQKSIFAIGKIILIVEAMKRDGKIDFLVDAGDEKLLNEDIKNRISEAIADGMKFNHNLENRMHNYYIVEKYIKTDFKKDSHGGLFGQKNFDLTEYIDGMTKKTNIVEIADALKNNVWR